MSETTIYTPLFRAGDVVMVNRDLRVNFPYEMCGEDISDGWGCCFIGRMAGFRGDHVTIREVCFTDTPHPRYKIKEDSGAFYWTDGMFEPPASYAPIEVDERDWSSFFAGFSGR